MSGTQTISYKYASMVAAGNMTATITSSAVDLQDLNIYAIQAVYTGSPVGTLKLQVSVDGTNYDDYTGSSLAVSAAGSNTWKVSAAGERYVRLVYTFSSGSGTLDVSLSGKG